MMPSSDNAETATPQQQPAGHGSGVKEPKLMLKLRLNGDKKDQLRSVWYSADSGVGTAKASPGKSQLQQLDSSPEQQYRPSNEQDPEPTDDIDDSDELYFSLKIYACLATSGKVSQHVNHWERELGVKSKQDIDDEQVCIPKEASLVVATEHMTTDPFLPVVLFCKQADGEHIYVAGLSKLLPMVAIIYDPNYKRDQWPSLIEQLDRLRHEGILEIVEKVDGSSLKHRTRFREVNGLFEKAIEGELKAGRKLRQGMRCFTRWSARVDQHFDNLKNEDEVANGKTH